MSLHSSSLIIISMLGMLFVYIETESDVERGARLTGGTTSMDGIVEVYMREQWVLVCDDWFDEKDGMVICRMIGADEGLPMLFTSFANFESNPYALVSGVFGYSQLECEGTENNISECVSSTTPHCGLSEQVGLKCHSPGEQPWTPGARSTQAGRPMVTLSPPNATTTTHTTAATTTPNITMATATKATMSESPITTIRQSTTRQLTTTTNLTHPTRLLPSDSPRNKDTTRSNTIFRNTAGIIAFAVGMIVLILYLVLVFRKKKVVDPHRSDNSQRAQMASPIPSATVVEPTTR